ncbi:MAG: MaoC family dehydratase [Chloroflexi bacterium]|nr:MaoC family dehydratase [Chloroflexota bacterium]
MASQLVELQEGGRLPEITKTVIQENINRYAEASRDFNPIHIDEEFARKTQHGGTIAHGMLVLAYVSEMMTAAFGRNWLTSGKLDVRFKAAAHPGETITVSGQITKLSKSGGQTAVTCSILCRNQKNEPVITGEATLVVPEV